MRHAERIPVILLDSPVFQKPRVIRWLIGLHDHGVLVEPVDEKTVLTVGVEPRRPDDLDGAGLLQVLSSCVKQGSRDLVVVEGLKQADPANLALDRTFVIGTVDKRRDASDRLSAPARNVVLKERAMMKE